MTTPESRMSLEDLRQIGGLVGSGRSPLSCLDGIASAARRARMGIRVEVAEGESIEDALRRFRKRILAEGGYPLIFPCKWHKWSPRFYLKPSVLNRRRRWITRVRRLGCGHYSPDWKYDWADDLEMKPRRSWGRLGRVVIT